MYKILGNLTKSVMPKLALPKTATPAAIYASGKEPHELVGNLLLESEGNLLLESGGYLLTEKQ